MHRYAAGSPASTPTKRELLPDMSRVGLQIAGCMTNFKESIRSSDQKDNGGESSYEVEVKNIKVIVLFTLDYPYCRYVICAGSWYVDLV